MNKIIKNIFQFASSQPLSIAIENNKNSVSYKELATQIKTTSDTLLTHRVSKLAINLPNGSEWAITDLSSLHANITSIPVPPFFSQEQFQHLLDDAQVTHIISDKDSLAQRQLEYDEIIIIQGNKYYITTLLSAVTKENTLSELKVSYTSGTTGHPKGVKLSTQAIETVTTSITQATAASANDRHLCLLPLSLLLENIAGLYVILGVGGTLIIPHQHELGFEGSSSFTVRTLFECLQKWNPTTLICVPQIAKALVIYAKQLGWRNTSVRFIAVGGAPISNQLIDEAKLLGIPLYQGYGLTECTSVVSINTPLHQKSGSVGKLLPHIHYRNIKGEIYFKGATCNGYINQPSNSDDGFWKTGDIGHVDDDGYLFITGRKKTTYCTSFGRNVSPEWVESELLQINEFIQTVVIGEAKPFNIAIITLVLPLSVKDIMEKIKLVNQKLPDYASIQKWIITDTPFSKENGLLSNAGVIRRHEITKAYQQQIANIYLHQSNETVS